MLTFPCMHIRCASRRKQAGCSLYAPLHVELNLRACSKLLLLPAANGWMRRCRCDRGSRPTQSNTLHTANPTRWRCYTTWQMQKQALLGGPHPLRFGLMSAFLSRPSYCTSHSARQLADISNAISGAHTSDGSGCVLPGPAEHPSTRTSLIKLSSISTPYQVF